MTQKNEPGVNPAYRVKISGHYVGELRWIPVGRKAAGKPTYWEALRIRSSIIEPTWWINDAKKQTRRETFVSN